MAAVLAAGTALPLSAACAAQPEQPGMAVGHPARDLVPVITVTGRGVVSGAPDRAIVRLGVTAEGRAAGEAQSKVNAAMTKVIEQIKAKGIDRAKIQTSGLSLSPFYTESPRRRDEPFKPEIAGYRASNTVTITIDELGSIGEIIDTGLAAGANTVEGVTFTLRDDLPQRRDALAAAAAEARVKAQAIVGAMNLQLGGVVEVVEGGADVVRPMFRGREMAMMDGTPVETGQVEVSATVTVSYRLVGEGAGGR